MTLRSGISTVVILTVVAVVLALFCEAVIKVRQAAGAASCQNNLRQIGSDIHSYADSYHGRLPGTHTDWIGPGNRTDEEFCKKISWLYGLWPFMEARMDAAVWFDPTKPLVAPENRRIIESWYPCIHCPANPITTHHDNYSSYVGITGVGKDAAKLPFDDPRSGFFGATPRSLRTDFRDGHATTLALMETATDNGPWALSGNSTCRGLDIEGTDYLGEHGQFNSLHRGNALESRPWVTHALFADSSVRGLRASLAPEMLEALATIAGGETLPFDW